ncbi:MULTISPECIES: V-type ATP synthase subunit A [Ruminococcus]|uniref:V-type ATP synthase alpha chain n=1 Tax=Ruminococcus albus 8 TaxID=246199 RepID=E9S9V3_RUMAL|nr:MULTISPECIES: V-type ATP synthase subunit A [Ruminococcus]EGC03825.1 ATP synthase ab C terminal domain protein [Ruminococcus albus 8]MBQ9541901.1 V-type ATP synthase subunit A [Ruminococcus sp.]MCC3350563.1 V-type ATP synthase subunit A [Ruminococcus albus 8]
MDKIYSVNGPVVTVRNTKSFSMQEMVFVGNKKLIGEVIRVSAKETTLQVYETTTGLKPGEPVYGTGAPMAATLGPGILDNMYDGIERPLKRLEEISGAFISEGANVPSLDTERKFEVTLAVKRGDMLRPGQIYATCPETALITHKCMLSPLSKGGEVIWTAVTGKYTVNDVVCRIRDEYGREEELTLCQKWPIRTPRPCAERMPMSRPLITGQRIIDTVVPVAKGGTAAIPGGFGTGKTMNQHQIAKWCDADIIVYVGCGERGNEMTQVLEEFSELIDPKTQRPLTDRTTMIANTSNMPVAAREASIYTGITLAEYYRDMGYHIAIMADSTSRWAEALREISGRLEEMPAEEGFPAYLPSRISEFYERAGYVKTLGGAEGSVTIIGAVSPQGSDFSEPVTQNTKRFVRCFWALDKALAYARHYPAINWNTSYSEYTDDLSAYYKNNVAPDFMEVRQQISNILVEENSLMEIVKLMGTDVLPDDQKLLIEVARVVRVGFLQQNAYHKDDTYVPLDKQYRMMKAILQFFELSKEALGKGVSIDEIMKNGWADKLIKIKYDIPNDKLGMFDEYEREMTDWYKKAEVV